MSTYVIGDIQGCMSTLERLLDVLAFVPGRDRLILVGDLVNRGPRSLDTLRFVHSLGESALTVLGNHDMHLIGIVADERRQKAGDTLTEIIEAPDRDVLLDWLRSRPLVLDVDGWTIVHAGLLPCWSLEQAHAFAREAERAMATPEGIRTLLTTPFPEAWSASVNAPVRASMALAVLTRVRMCRAPDTPDFKWKKPPESAPARLFPWYADPHPSWARTRICFGHWAALGFRRLAAGYALDSGCVWGRTLSALRLEDEHVFEIPAVD